MPRKRGKRRSHAANNNSLKRTRAETEAERDQAAIDDAAPPAIASSTSSSSLSSSSSSSSFSSSSSSSFSSDWHNLPLELLVLIADCVPSYRLLLPLSSTCRRLYELIHEEDTSGVLQTANAIHGVAVRLSCWRHHPLVQVTVGAGHVRVDLSRMFVIEERGALFVSSVLTSLRAVPHLDLVYTNTGGPHAVFLHPLRHFTYLRSLTLEVDDEVDMTRQQNLAANLSAALLALPSLVSLTATHLDGSSSLAQVVETSALQRLVSERLLHITLNQTQYEQLTTPEISLGRRTRRLQSLLYPRLVSVAFVDTDGPTLVDILRVFPNVQHVAVSSDTVLDVTEMSQHAGEAPAFCLDSLHMRIDRVQCVSGSGLRCQLRCLVLHWDHDVLPEQRVAISALLALMPQLTQLAIAGGTSIKQRSHVVLPEIPSIFDTDDVQLPALTYLQFTGGLLRRDIEYLLSTTSPPSFAASLTHLVLCLRVHDIRLITHFAVLPVLYPSLQKCHIGLLQFPCNVEPEEWQRGVTALRTQLGSVWCDSAEEVQMARADMKWRYIVGLCPMATETNPFTLHAELEHMWR